METTRTNTVKEISNSLKNLIKTEMSKTTGNDSKLLKDVLKEILLSVEYDTGHHAFNQFIMELDRDNLEYIEHYIKLRKENLLCEELEKQKQQSDKVNITLVQYPEKTGKAWVGIQEEGKKNFKEFLKSTTSKVEDGKILKTFDVPLIENNIYVFCENDKENNYKETRKRYKVTNNQLVEF
jgi:hypothetical protein